MSGDDRSEAATEIATMKRPARAGDPGETVRVLGARRPRRTGEGTPAPAAPGTAAIGARHIEPGQTPQRSAAAAWLARALAFAALAVVVLALHAGGQALLSRRARVLVAPVRRPAPSLYFGSRGAMIR